jgi:hypothetical protein
MKSMIMRLILTMCLGELGTPLHPSSSSGGSSVGVRDVSIFSNIRVSGPEMRCEPPVPLQVQLPR